MSTGSRAASDEAWFLPRLVAYRLGLLEPADEIRFERLIADSDSCRQAWQTYVGGEEEQPFDAHIPAAILARWAAVRDNLRGLERQLTRKHLETCAECREDLEKLGFEPTLVPRPELEWLAAEPKTEFEGGGAAAVRADEDEGRSQRHPGLSPSRIRALRRPPWREWTIVGWAAAASFAAVLLWFHRPLGPAGSDSSQGGIIPWAAPALVRGSGGPSASSSSTLKMKPGARSILLTLRVPPGLDAERAASVEIFDPTDRSLLHVSVESADLRRPMLALLLRSTQPLSPGSYRVVLRSGGDPSSPASTVETFFELRLMEP